MKLKKTAATLMALALAAAIITGCDIGNMLKWPETPTETAAETDTAPPPPTATDTDTQPPTETAPPTTDGTKEIVYEDGLIVLTIKDGKAEITFDDDLWEKRYGLYGIEDPEYYSDDLILPGPFPIEDYEGAISDACIVPITSLKMTSTLSATTIPTAVLLMQDGGICLVCASPYTEGPNTEFYCRRLPWLKDIASISADTDKNGDATVYATDAQGIRYDVRIPAELSYILNVYDEDTYYNNEFSRTLYCTMTNEYACLQLTLFDNGQVLYRICDYNGQIFDGYSGKYEVQLAEDPGRGKPPAGAISFDLHLTYTISEYDPEDLTDEDIAYIESYDNLDGIYMTQRHMDQIYIEGGKPVLVLEYISGKGLVLRRDSSVPDEEFQFYDYNIAERGYPRDESDENYWYYGDKDDEEAVSLAKHVLYSVSEAYSEVMEHGKYLWTDGTDISFVSGAVGKIVRLVNYVPDYEFDILATYAIIEDGTIYRRNPSDEMWYPAE